MQQQDSMQQPKGLNEVPQTKPGYWAVRLRAAVIGFVIAVLAVGAHRVLLNEQQSSSQYNVNDETTLQDTNEPVSDEVSDKSDKIVLEYPLRGGMIESPLKITGQARGTWYFEASFPIVLVDWDGKIIAESHAEAQVDPDDSVGAGWMTEEFVPFEGTTEFISPYKSGDPDFMKRGTLILRKDNPSGLPEHDDALEVPILFAP